MALWLTNEDVQQVLDMNICLEELDRAFGALGRGEAIERYPSRALAYMPLTGPDHQFQFRTIEGGVGDYWGIRVFPQVLKFPVINGVRRRVAVPAADGDRYCGFLLIFNVHTAEMVAGLHDGYVNWLATGGTAGLGLKYQMRRDAKVAGMIGAGWFGRSVFWATHTGAPVRARQSLCTDARTCGGLRKRNVGKIAHTHRGCGTRRKPRCVARI